jgi:hypothetical protein
VGEVQPRDVHAGADELGNECGRAGSRTDGGDNLGALGHATSRIQQSVDSRWQAGTPKL